jgi:hypothetical protein
MIISKENYTYRVDGNKFILTIYVNSEISEEIQLENRALIYVYLYKYKDNNTIYIQNINDITDCSEYDLINNIGRDNWPNSLKIKRIC